MGKFTDLVLAIIVLVVGVWFLTKLNLTAGQIWNMFWKFFSSSSGSSSNTTAGLIVGIGMAISNSQLKSKIREKKEMILRAIKISQFSKPGYIVLNKIKRH